MSPWWTKGGSSKPKPPSQKVKKRLPNELIFELVNAIPIGKLYASEGANSIAYDTYKAEREKAIPKLIAMLKSFDEALEENLQEATELCNEVNTLTKVLEKHFEVQSADEYAADPENHQIEAKIQTMTAQYYSLKQPEAELRAKCSELNAKLEEYLRELEAKKEELREKKAKQEELEKAVKLKAERSNFFSVGVNSLRNAGRYLRKHCFCCCF